MSGPNIPDSLLLSGYQGFLPGVMLPGHEADYCLPRSAWVKMSGALPVSSAHVRLRGVQRDNFKFAYYDFI